MAMAIHQPFKEAVTDTTAAATTTIESEEKLTGVLQTPTPLSLSTCPVPGHFSIKVLQCYRHSSTTWKSSARVRKP
jgi:hypothetical protein